MQVRTNRGRNYLALRHALCESIDLFRYHQFIHYCERGHIVKTGKGNKEVIIMSTVAFTPDSLPDLNGRVYLVTGGNTGL